MGVFFIVFIGATLWLLTQSISLCADVFLFGLFVAESWDIPTTGAMLAARQLHKVSIE